MCAIRRIVLSGTKKLNQQASCYKREENFLFHDSKVGNGLDKIRVFRINTIAVLVVYFFIQNEFAMKNVLSIVLIAAALIFGYLGVDKINKSGGSVDILGVEISAQDKGAKSTGYIYLGIGAVCLFAGVMAMRKS